MGSARRYGDVTVKPCDRKRGGRLKTLEWKGHVVRLEVRPHGTHEGFFTLDTGLCRCFPAVRTSTEIADLLYVCDLCGLVATGSFRIEVSSSESLRLAALLEHWGEDVLSASIGASSIMDVALRLVSQYRKNGLPSHVVTHR